MTVSIQQIHPVFVAEVSGTDCAHPLSDAEVAAIKAGMDEYGVLVFHDQPLTDEQQLRFTLQFGTMEPGFGNIRAHFRAGQEVRTLGAGIADFSNLDGAGKPLPPDNLPARLYGFKGRRLFPLADPASNFDLLAGSCNRLARRSGARP